MCSTVGILELVWKINLSRYFVTQSNELEGNKQLETSTEYFLIYKIYNITVRSRSIS